MPSLTSGRAKFKMQIVGNSIGVIRGPFPITTSSMKAVILAAGKGTRMRELTNELPKPMLKVQDKPILEHIIEGIIGAGIREVFIVTGFRAEVVEQYFGDGSKWGVRIE